MHTQQLTTKKDYLPLLANFKEILRLNDEKHPPARHFAFIIMADILQRAEKDLTDELIKDIDQFIFSLVHFNEVNFLQQLCRNKDFIINNLKKQDPLKHARFLNGLNDTDIFIHAVSQNAAPTLEFLGKLGWESSLKHFEIAIENHAKKSLAYLLKQGELKDTDKKTLIELAKDSGDLAILKMLAPEVSLCYFNEILVDFPKNISFRKIFNIVSKAYRYSSMQDVDELCEKLINQLETKYDKEIYKTEIKKIKQACYYARKLFPEWASQLALLKRKKDLHELGQFYNASSAIEKEIYQGSINFKIVEEILSKLQTSESDLLSWESILKLIVTKRGEQALTDHTADADIFLKMRSDEDGRSPFTPCWGRYDHLYHMIKEEFNNTPEEAILPGNVGYLMQFNKKIISTVLLETKQVSEYKLDTRYCYFWRHGLGSINEITPEINKIIKILLTLDTASVQKNPQVFYDNVVLLIWLIGNLTPVWRGTGRVVEVLLALLHKYHGFNPVVLNGYQLDCLDITFRTPERYRELFFYLFKSSTLPFVVQTLMQEQYEQSAELQELLIKYQIEPPTTPLPEPLFFTEMNQAEAKATDFWEKTLTEEFGTDIETLKKEGESFKEAFLRHNSERAKITNLHELATLVLTYPDRPLLKIISEKTIIDLLPNIYILQQLKYYRNEQERPAAEYEKLIAYFIPQFLMNPALRQHYFSKWYKYSNILSAFPAEKEYLLEYLLKNTEFFMHLFEKSSDVGDFLKHIHSFAGVSEYKCLQYLEVILSDPIACSRLSLNKDSFKDAFAFSLPKLNDKIKEVFERTKAPSVATIISSDVVSSPVFNREKAELSPTITQTREEKIKFVS